MPLFQFRRFLCGILLGLAVLILGAGCRGRTKAVETVSDVAEARIGVMTGSIGESIARNRFPKSKVQAFDDVMDAVTAIKSGQLEAVVTAFPTGFQIAKRNADLVVLEEPLDNEETAVALRKEDTVLLGQVNQVIADLRRDGTLEAMHRRWFKPDLRPYEVPPIPVATNGAPLRIGVSATREPLTFVDDRGEVSGHDGELARRIGLALGRPVEFANMKFMALIPALQSGKIDLIVTGVNATEERRKSVAFSDPYFANAQVMLVRKAESARQRPMSAFPELGIRPTSGVRPGPSLDSLDGKAIGVLSGSAGDLAARKRFAKSRFDSMMSAVDAALALQAHKIDGFVYDQSVLENLVVRNPDLVILGEPVAKLEIAGALRKDNTVLIGEIDRVMADLDREQVLQQLNTKWVDSKYTVVPEMPPAPTDGDRGVLRLGTSPDMEPYSFVSNGKIVGLDIELAGILARRLHRRLEIVGMNFEGLIPALQAGKVDIALSNFNVTEERKKLIAYSRPYIVTAIRVLVRREGGAPAPAAANTGGIERYRKSRIGTLLGSAHSTWVSKNLPEAMLLEFSSPSDISLAVKAGKVDVALSDSSPLRELMRQDPSFTLIGSPLFGYPVAAGVRKDSGDLRIQFNRFLSSLRTQGTYDQMVERWIRKGDFQMPSLPDTGTNGVIKVGMTDGGMPFVGVQDGKLVGFEIELVRRFAASIGKRPEFSNMDFAALIPALVSGKVDLIVASIFVTDERRKQIDFTDPYHEETTQAYALKGATATGSVAGAAAPREERKPFLDRVRESFQSNVLHERRYLLLWDGLKTTVLISLGSALFGTLLGALVCWMRMARNTLLSGLAKVYISMLRGTPVLVILMMIFYVVFASVDIHPVLVAILAFGLNFAAYAAEIFRSGIEGIDRGQSEAGIAMGFTRFQTFRFILLPQTLQRILPVYKGECISLVKMTSIVGYIAVQDLTKASDIIRSRTFDAFFPLVMVAILYFLIAWVLMQGLGRLERTVERRRKTRKEARA